VVGSEEKSSLKIEYIYKKDYNTNIKIKKEKNYGKI